MSEIAQDDWDMMVERAVTAEAELADLRKQLAASSERVLALEDRLRKIECMECRGSELQHIAGCEFYDCGDSRQAPAIGKEPAGTLPSESQMKSPESGCSHDWETQPDKCRECGIEYPPPGSKPPGNAILKRTEKITAASIADADEIAASPTSQAREVRAQIGGIGDACNPHAAISESECSGPRGHEWHYFSNHEPPACRWCGKKKQPEPESGK